MNSKKIVTVILMLLLLAMQLPVFAAESAVVEIPFTVENTAGTVVIETDGDLPLPSPCEFTDVTEGKFSFSLEEPGDYAYRIYQKPGNESGVTYDETVYEVLVSVFVDEKEDLYAVVTLRIAGDSRKPEKVAFANILPEPEAPKDPKDPNKPTTGDSGMPFLWGMLGTVSLAGALILLPVAFKKRER